ncbi:ATP-dependent DNA helicase RecQ [Limibacter armeniacum]|uniref:RecQ family ATP-dependent DNA helicase n=1 Tax=Limibacter armeniacum TaxID=466084 RepID=UPI002FE58AA5
MNKAVNLQQILKRFWGYDQFRPLQEDIIRSVIDGHDTLALLPTGGGKSICFQVPALAINGVCVVVTPLIALMKDQVEQLRRRGIPAVAIYTGMSRREIDILLDNVVYGKVKFLYLSPERLKTPIFQERVQKMNVGLLAIDEAHCISQWGYDFRPQYLEIAELRKQLPEIPCIALTATATKSVQQDIVKQLSFKEGYNHFQKSFSRANLSYSTFEVEDKNERMLGILKNVEGSAIVYVRTRRKAEEVSYFLRTKQVSADFYHAGIENVKRAEKQEAWIAGKIRVMVATNAFGMGIDKPDVRTVIHFDMPDTLEAYYQEAGRAGRDEKKAYGVLLYQKKDFKDMIAKTEASYPSIDIIKKVYQALANYYKLAAGSGEMATYDFNLEDFVRTYELDYMQAFYVLKRLEDQEFVQFNDSLKGSSRILIKADKQDLYKFQVANAHFDAFLKLVLRVYGGELFTNFVSVSENKIATLLNMPYRDVVSAFQEMDAQDIIIYENQKEQPQLTFLKPRYTVQQLPFNIKKMQEEKMQEMARIKSVINYARNKERCRTLMLLEYFDEQSDAYCGVCDNCLKKKKRGQLGQMDSIAEQIMKVVQEGTASNLKNLEEQVGPVNRQKFVEVLRKMIDSGELDYRKGGDVTHG